jgi:Domain of unknown function (DUF1963)
MDESSDPPDPSDLPEPTTRRGWLSELARNARRRVQEGAEAVGPQGLPGLLAQLDLFGDGAAPGSVVPGSDVEDLSATGWDSARRPARAPDRVLSAQELLALANEEGLTGRDDALRALARSSLRMTSVVPRCAEGWIHPTDEWVDVAGSEVLLAQIDLAATRGFDAELPTEGWLVLFAGTDDEPSGGEGFHAHGVLLEHPAAVLPAAEPVALGAELALPRVWNHAVQSLDLDEAESDAYTRVRARLQGAQGVERDDDGGPLIAYHRLLGYPDDTTGSMPAECAGEESDAADWRLLAQVSVGAFRRAYLWIRDADLVAGNFADLRAFVR